MSKYLIDLLESLVWCKRAFQKILKMVFGYGIGGESDDELPTDWHSLLC